MKNAAFLFYALCAVVISSCQKGNQKIVNTPLIGKWSVFSLFVSDGSPGKWVYPQYITVQYVKFDTNGSLSGNQFSQYSTYKIEDDTTVTLLKNDNTAQNYQYKINKDTLTMSPAGALYCIEGCAIKFIKMK